MADPRAPGHLTAVMLAAALLTACAADTPPNEAPDDDTTASEDTTADETAAEEAAPRDTQRFPDVIDAELEPQGDAWRLDATLSSPTTPRSATPMRSGREPKTAHSSKCATSPATTRTNSPSPAR